MQRILTEHSVISSPAAMRLAVSQKMRPVDELLELCSFPPAGESLNVAVSGGPDSVALCTLAVMAGLRVSVFHVDHGLRPTSAEEAKAVGDLAEGLGLPFHLITESLGLGPNLEARARALRKEKIPEGATGHTMDDQAETVMINLARGAGPRGLGAMRPGPAKPILGLRRTETEAICRALGLVPVLDPSNETADYLRNRVRRELLPLLAAMTNRDPVPILARSADVFREEDDLLDGLAAELDVADREALAAAPGPLRRRALRLAVAEVSGYPPDRASLDALDALVTGSQRFRRQLAGGVEVVCARGRITISRFHGP